MHENLIITKRTNNLRCLKNHSSTDQTKSQKKEREHQNKVGLNSLSTALFLSKDCASLLLTTSQDTVSCTKYTMINLRPSRRYY